ncbi:MULTISPECIES: hypothetical protein [unclassified Corynebacterium]|uniref:hypothetical protein n=1 Tax=unclassified Corynebacterium TaxID=2624378 RepID=UPI0035243C89
MSPFTSRITTAGAVLATAFLISLPTAWAVPPGGASSDTPGTSSSISPQTVAPCDSLSYSVYGFPPGETLNIKIDDGAGFNQSVHGTGVVGTQVISSDGSASGSVQLPCDINDGEHWLRFLASEPVGDDSALGSKGYSHHSDYFTVSSGNNNSGGDSDSGAGRTGGDNNAAARDNSGGSRRTASPQGNRSQGSRNTENRGGAQRSTITKVVDEPAANAPHHAGAGGAVRAEAGSGTRSGDGGRAAKPLGQTKLSAGGNGTVTTDTDAGDDGDAYYEYVPVQQTAQAANSQAPIVGMLIGGAILVVGLSGVGAYLFTHRNNTAPQR